MHGGDDLTAVGLGQQLLEERVWIRYALLLNDVAINDDTISPVQIAIILLAEALNEKY